MIGAMEIAAELNRASLVNAAVDGRTLARTLADAGPDFEDSVEWPVWTPDDVLALSLPALSGGSPEAAPVTTRWPMRECVSARP